MTQLSPVTQLHVVKGQPDADELAALAIALDIVRARQAASAGPQPSRWRTSLRTELRSPWRSGGGG